MKINDNVRKCVAFLQYKMADGSYKYAGTCFFVGIENKYEYAVTAKHVIEEVKKLGLDEIFIKVNLKNNKTDTVTTTISSWIFSEDENIDIALCKFSFQNNYDHLYFPRSSFLNDDIIKSNEIDCGDEVFITGLFKHHTGDTKNTPIVRIGNIALMPSEKIQVRKYLMDAYLVESRSIGGLSGSPTFVNLGGVRVLGGELKYAKGEMIPPLFGIICGHFDSKEGEIDAITSSADQEKINVGIAIVTPIAKLAEILDSLNG